MDLSLVIPVKEESENLPELMKEIWAAIEPTGMEFEVIIIDDGSRDNTWEVVEGLAKEYGVKPKSSVSAFRFQFNCGKAAALALGFSKARGKYVATLDGDLQDDPLEIPKMIKILESGYDLVSGWKIRRLDPWHKTMPSKLFNLTVSMVCGKRHRFIPVMAKWQGFRITEMPVAHRARVHGVSKYGVSRLVSGFLDLVSLMFMRSFSSKPLHFFGLIGLVLMLFGLGTCGYFGYEWFETGAMHVRPLLLAGAFSLVMSVQFFSLGLLGEMMNGNKKRTYPVSDVIGEL